MQDLTGPPVCIVAIVAWPGAHFVPLLGLFSPLEIRMKKYSFGVLFERFMRTLGWVLFFVFLYMLTWPFINCLHSKCNGEMSVAYVITIYAFIFPLPAAIVCLLTARDMKLCRQRKKDKAQESTKN
ncbi:MAG: hypothetical protein HYS17_00755 [Micavibrio aeruginosavorus]|uniref:Uncharacterized protein n=1 Tax=Micavibrio aeruginosavorus TaxID=349221 RepID=A0A7T5UHE9_9BACT|nr:MAG: hypothetical protein HYS17_00755 [Micavibrio aeruginosavorus]